jgi:tetraacyldisaccharide 4'-kinase
MRWFDPLLSPFAFLYGAATDFRNHLFDLGVKKSTNFLIPTVAVGNLRIGGTGKTPMVEFLVRSLLKDYSIAVLSRGYGRKTTGFRLAHSDSQATEIGDEPLQIFTKFSPQINVAVSEDRVLAIPEILFQAPDTELVILDDAFQHRYLKADAYILLTTFQQPFFKDKLLPLGGLREKRKGVKRADIIVVTKCPANVSSLEKKEYIRNIYNYVDIEIPVLFSSIEYGMPIEVSNTSQPIKKQVILLSGLANSVDFKNKVQEEYQIVGNFEFRDHYKYKPSDFEELKKIHARFPQSVIMTTEKDAVKLRSDEFKDLLSQIPIYVLPIEVKFNEMDQGILINFMHQLVQKKAYTREI